LGNEPQAPLNTGRIYRYDNIRALCIFFIVLATFYFARPSIKFAAYNWIGSHRAIAAAIAMAMMFTLTLFAFVSGCLAARHERERAGFLKRFIGIVLLFLLAVTVTTLSEPPPEGEWITIAETHYLGFLAIAMFLEQCLQRLAPKWALLVVFVSCLLLTYAGFTNAILGKSVYMLPVYFFGRLCTQSAVFRRITQKPLWWAGIAALGVLYTIVFLLPQQLRTGLLILGETNLLVAGNHTWFVPVGRLAAYGIAGILSAAVFFAVPNRRIPGISAIGGKTLQIYVFAYPLAHVWARLHPQSLSFLMEYEIGGLPLLIPPFCAAVIWLLSRKWVGVPLLPVLKAADWLSEQTERLLASFEKKSPAANPKNSRKRS
jgi:hypothetical protein